MSELENDHALPGGEAILRLADVLGTTTDFILRGAVSSEDAAAREPLRIPAALGKFADEKSLSYRATVALLDAHRLVVARRGKRDTHDWSMDDWARLYDRLREYLD